MTLREIAQELENRCMSLEGDYLEQLYPYQQLLQRVQFIEELIEDGLDLDDNFLISCIWKGE
jgi:hypothetical protein